MNSGTGSPIRHHPNEATLVAHAAGALWTAARPVVAAHLGRCPDCRAQVALAEAVGGLLLEGLPPAPLATDALQRTMERLDEQPDRGAAGTGAAPAARHSAATAADGPLAATLRGLGLPFPPLRWLGPGLRQAVLLHEPGTRGGTLRLLRVRPGCAILRHAHHGAELTCVLEGAFADESGRYGPGDLAEATAETDHRPVAEGAEECVCLVANQGRPRFGGLLGRVIGAFCL